MREPDDKYVLEFPYPPPEGSSQCFGGSDLVKNYELCTTIREAQEFSPLREMILALNSPTSIYRTYGCDSHANDDFAGYMLHFGYRSIHQGNKAQTVDLFEGFLERCQSEFPESKEWFDKSIRWHIGEVCLYDRDFLWTIMFDVTTPDIEALDNFSIDFLEYLLAGS